MSWLQKTGKQKEKNKKKREKKKKPWVEKVIIRMYRDTVDGGER